MNPYLQQALLDARVEDLRHAAARSGRHATLLTLASRLPRRKRRTAIVRVPRHA